MQFDDHRNCFGTFVANFQGRQQLQHQCNITKKPPAMVGWCSNDDDEKYLLHRREPFVMTRDSLGNIIPHQKVCGRGGRAAADGRTGRTKWLDFTRHYAAISHIDGEAT